MYGMAFLASIDKAIALGRPICGSVYCCVARFSGSTKSRSTSVNFGMPIFAIARAVLEPSDPQPMMHTLDLRALLNPLPQKVCRRACFSCGCCPGNWGGCGD